MESKNDTGKHEIDTKVQVKVEPCLLEETTQIKSEQEVNVSSDLHIKRESSSFASVFIVQSDTGIHGMENNIHIKKEAVENHLQHIEDNVSGDQHFILPDSIRLDAEGAWNDDSGVTSAGLDMGHLELRENGIHCCENANVETFQADDKMSYKCKICGKCFNVASDLQTHVAIHDGKRKHRCDICDKVFLKPSILKKHLQTHIPKHKKEHKCNICERIFPKPSLLKRHSFMHGGIRPFQCDKCDKSFTLSSNLSRHKLYHEGIRPYKCERCEKAFTEASHLKDHSLIHDGIKPFKCNRCDKSFTTKSTLKKHNLFHEGKRPHKCELCQKSYILASHLKNHKLSHEGENLPESGISEKNLKLGF